MSAKVLIVDDEQIIIKSCTRILGPDTITGLSPIETAVQSMDSRGRSR